jgi:hypothetical protein
MRKYRLTAVLLALLVALGLAATALAQTDVTTSRIAGTVKDNNGAPLPGVTVEAKNQDTGFATSSVTGTDGGYRLVNLPTGKYTLTASLGGFSTVSRPNIDLRLGSAPTVNFTMQLTAVAETITVTSRAPIVEVTNTQASTTIDTEQLKSLPISGRNFTNLVLLTPQTRVESERGNVAISGQRGINTNITVDGVDYNNSFFGGSTGVAEGRAPFSLSAESVKELTVITNGASVEFGRSAGGFVNVITKGGTNDIHGSGFYYKQPQSLISDFKNGTKPADQHKTQYGASVGGPIMRDRLFYFGSYDKQDRSITVPINPLVLDAQIAAKYPALASDPTYAQSQNGWVAFGRLDFQASNAQRFMLRGNKASYTGDNGTSGSANRSSLTNGVERMDAGTYVGSWSATFGQNMLNDLNGTMSREYTPRVDKSPTLPEIQVNLGGTMTYGGVSFLPIISTVKRKGFEDTYSYLLSKHIFKAGVQYDDTSVSQTFKGNWRGVFVFPSKDAFLGGRWTQYRQFGGLGGLTADQAGTVSFGQKETALFVQDQWYVSPNITVSAGVRWEKLDNPDAPVLNPNDRNADGTYKLNGTIPDVNNQISPRFGITWSPGDQKTVIRATAGRFWSRTPALLWAQTFSSNGLRGTQLLINVPASSTTGPTDPLAPAWGANWNPVGVERIDFTKVKTVPAPGVFTVAPDFTNPRTNRFTLGVDRELAHETAVGLDYTYAKSVNLERLTDLNLARDGKASSNGMPHYGARPIPAYGRVTTYTSDAQSKYWALTGTFRRRFAQNFRANAVVTYSKDRDNDSNERNFSGPQLEDMKDPNGSWGYSVRDQRWKTSANFVWDTPWWGIAFSGAYRYYTGSTFTPVLGVDANGDGVFTDRPTVGCATPTACQLGEGNHLARSSYHAPEQHFLDARLGKSFNVVGGKISVFAECFNCSNAANRSPGSVFSTWSTNNSNTPSATFGQFKTYGDPRTWQLAARFDF